MNQREALLSLRLDIQEMISAIDAHIESLKRKKGVWVYKCRMVEQKLDDITKGRMEHGR